MSLYTSTALGYLSGFHNMFLLIVVLFIYFVSFSFFSFVVVLSGYVALFVQA